MLDEPPQTGGMEVSLLKTLIGTALAGLLTLTGEARAQDWPRGPLTMVVPFAAGGTTDVLGRIMAQRLGEILGQAVVVENIGGAGGMTGSLRVAHAQPDGSLFLFGALGPQVLNPALHSKAAYNSVTDFAPVALLVEVPLVLITRKDLPIGDLQGFIAHAKANQATMNFGSAGIGSAPHIGCVLLNTAMGTKIAHVPYRGMGSAAQDLITGRIDFYCDALPTALGLIEGSDTVKPIAILSRTRAPVVPNLPTGQEQGLAEFEAYTWFALFLPANTPEAIVRHLHDATVEAVKTPSVRERMEALGATLVAPGRMTPDYLAEFVRSEVDKWGASIKAAGISVN
jgi:tripartite-type tricarboxylate transporter receptor subunit TctC